MLLTIQKYNENEISRLTKLNINIAHRNRELMSYNNDLLSNNKNIQREYDHIIIKNELNAF